MLKKLTIKDLPKAYQDIAQEIGIESFKKLVKLMGGSSIYIPKEQTLTRPIRNKTIKENFKGDYKNLATKYNITKTQIRNIIKN